jgi:hypothetical protein
LEGAEPEVEDEGREQRTEQLLDQQLELEAEDLRELPVDLRGMRVPEPALRRVVDVGHLLVVE